MKIHKVISLLLAPMMLLTSCATIVHGTTQKIGISSNPTNAYVFVDNYPMGTTPVMVDLKRNQNHFVRIELPGFVPYEIVLTRQISGWVFGNIIFGGFIGLAVDAVSGGIYRLTPEQVSAQMFRDGICRTSHSSDASYIGVVMKADPSWEKVGTLARAQ